ncbi:hypothetical protein MMC13_004984 [Lambiella insularis]|nr:hypothetical protein [Lambiella insularis]
MLGFLFFAILAGFALATQPGLRYRFAQFSGVATFNDYAAQTNTVCGPKAGVAGTFGAAAGDISPQISGGLCYSKIEMNNCVNEAPKIDYVGPACPTINCGLCYSVTNNGGYGGSPIGGMGNSIIVQIIDSCPSVSAWNYCKTMYPMEQRCGNPKVNQLDIDQSAYVALTGVAFTWGVPSLDIGIAPVLCPP